MEKIVEQGLLYDFYGELLTDHQKKIYEDAVYNDMSLAEIAEKNEVSRQAISDIIRRCTIILKSYEDRLHMIKRFDELMETAKALKAYAGDTSISSNELSAKVTELSDKIIEELS